MKLIANGLNKQFFSSFLPPPDTEIDGVVAAIAYGDDKTSLLDHCIKNHHRLDIWMRYDHTVPVSPAFLSKLLANVKNVANITFSIRSIIVFILLLHDESSQISDWLIQQMVLCSFFVL